MRTFQAIVIGGAVRARLTLDHLLASAAIPILFHAVRLDGEFFGDGSMRQTAPLAPAIHLGAEHCSPGAEARPWSLAAGHSSRLPRRMRCVFRGIGGQGEGALDFLSYLLFDPAYTSQLIELGCEDARAQWPAIEAFLGSP